MEKFEGMTFADKLEYLNKRKELLSTMYASSRVPVSYKKYVINAFEVECFVLTGSVHTRFFEEEARRFANYIEIIADAKTAGEEIYKKGFTHELYKDKPAYLNARIDELMRLYKEFYRDTETYDLAFYKLLKMDVHLLYSGKDEFEKYMTRLDNEKDKFKSSNPRIAFKAEKFNYDPSENKTRVIWIRIIEKYMERELFWRWVYKDTSTPYSAYDEVQEAFLTDIELRLLTKRSTPSIHKYTEVKFQRSLNTNAILSKIRQTLDAENNIAPDFKQIRENYITYIMGREEKILKKYRNMNVPKEMYERVVAMYELEARAVVQNPEIEKVFVDRFKTRMNEIYDYKEIREAQFKADISME